MAERDPSLPAKEYGTQSTLQPPLDPSAPPAYEELFGHQTKCPVHRFEDITMFCDDHQALCCDMCWSEQNVHRFCPGIKYIADIIRGRSVNSELQYALHEVRRKQHDVEMVKKMKLQRNHAFDQAMANIESAGQALQQKIWDRVNALKLEAGLDVAKCDEFVMDIENQMQLMGIAESKDEIRMFVELQKANQKIHGADFLIQQLSDSNNRCYDIEQSLDADIKPFLTSIDALTKVTRMGEKVARTGQPPSEPTIDRIPIRSLAEVRDHEYEVIHTRRCMLQMPGQASGDEMRYEIKACCQLPNGQLLMMDHYNHRVILVHPGTYAVLDCCKLSKAPLSLSTFRESKAVMSLDVLFGAMLAFFDVQNSLIMHLRYIEADIGLIKDVIHHENEFYCLAECVKVVNADGQLMRKIKFKRDPYVGRRIAVSPDGTRLYITGSFIKGHDLVTIDKNGEVVATLKDPRLQNSYDICVDKAGNVFLTGKDSNNVCQISRSGHKVLRELATAADGIESPRAVCFDQNNSALVVVNSGRKGGGERVHVLTLK